MNKKLALKSTIANTRFWKDTKGSNLFLRLMRATQFFKKRFRIPKVRVKPLQMDTNAASSLPERGNSISSFLNAGLLYRGLLKEGVIRHGSGWGAFLLLPALTVSESGLRRRQSAPNSYLRRTEFEYHHMILTSMERQVGSYSSLRT